MRYATPLMIALAFAVSAPALAQETNAADNAMANAADPAAIEANAMAVDPALANDVAMAPAPAPATDPSLAPTAAPAEDNDGGGFPWGLLGLLGLVGLIPRSRN